MGAQSQLIDKIMVLRHFKDFQELNKLKPENGGSHAYLNVEQTALLIEHLLQHIYHHSHQIAAYIAQRWHIFFTVFGLYKRLKQHDVSYKKPKDVPHKFNAEKQQ